MVSSLGEIHTLGVIGAGQMGSGIAQVAAHPGHVHVLVQDVNPQGLDKAKAVIDKSLTKLVEKGKLTDVERANALGRISYITGLSALSDADFVIEAIVEHEATKKELFQKLDGMLKPGAIIASNTSSISLTRLAAVTQRPDRVIGMHFMNPVPLMQLVEIIRGAQTSDTTAKVTEQLAKKFGKTTVMAKDFPGFISNRVLMPLINEAIFAVYEGVGSAEDIDTVMRLGMNHPMGPLALADFIGLDTCLSIMMILYDGFKDARFRPCPLLKQTVDAGYLGRKSGRGFFKYEPV